MLVVLPFWSGDVDRMEMLLRWMIRLDVSCLKEHDCLLSYERGSNPEKIAELAFSAFKSVRSFSYDPWAGDKAYPAPHNHAWQQAARYISEFSTSWLWLESDAVPLRKGWLTILDNAHKAGGKPFSGHIVKESHMTGVGIYPSPIYGHVNNALLARSAPFDIVAGRMDGVLPKVHRINDLIQHTPDVDFHFDNESDVDSIVTLEAVLFHRCKDGSLINVLSKKTPAIQAVPPLLKDCVKVESAIPTKGAVYHVVERHKETDPETNRRVSESVKSWIKIYDSKEMIPVHSWEPERKFGAKGLPYVKDVLLAGMNRAKNLDDIIVLTNDDTQLLPSVVRAIKTRIKGATCSFRANFEKGFDFSGMNPVEIEMRCEKDYGRDLFAFRKSWLRDNWWNIPDFVLGAPEWDVVLAILIRKTEGFASTPDNLKQILPCEMPRGWVIHEKHKPKWNSGPSEERSYNLALASEWYEKNNLKHLNTLAK